MSIRNNEMAHYSFFCYNGLVNKNQYWFGGRKNSDQKATTVQDRGSSLYCKCLHDISQKTAGTIKLENIFLVKGEMMDMESSSDVTAVLSRYKAAFLCKGSALRQKTVSGIFKYKLADGDEIVFAYTCDMGADTGYLHEEMDE